MTRPGQKLSEATKARARQRAKEWRKNNLEAARAYDAAYYRTNRGRLKKYARDRYHRSKGDPAARKVQQERQRRYYFRQKSKREGEEEAIQREMRTFQQEILASRGPQRYNGEGDEKRRR